MSDKSKKQSNYEILGLPDNADKTLVEKKYIALVREYRDRTNEYGTTNEDLKYYNKITKAYNDIMGISGDYSDTDPMSIIPYSIRKKWSKISYFFENYKMIICGVILLTAIVIMTIFQIKDSDIDDISIKFVGSFTTGYADSQDGYIDAQIAKKSDVVDAPIVSYFTVVEGETTLLDSNAIVMTTNKGRGVSFMENQVKWHGSAPNKEQYEQAVEEIKAAVAALWLKGEYNNGNRR